jgi:hypothetical protein
VGLGKWLARKGSIGSTARWAGEGFFNAVKANVIDLKSLENPSKATTEFALSPVVDFLLGTRHLGLNYKELQMLDLDKVPPAKRKDFEMYLSEITTYRLFDCKGLLKLVLSVLKVEADLHKNTASAIRTFVEVADEELKRMNIGQRFIYGVSLSASEDEIAKAKEYLISWASEPPA